MNEIIAVILITCLAVISPGADFAIVTRNSFLYGRRVGLYTALGIAGGVWVHIGFSVIGLQFTQSHMPQLLKIIQFIGAAYLIYLGYKTFVQTQIQLYESQIVVTAQQAFRTGFLTNSLNPKTTLFIVSLFSQLIQTDSNTIFKLVGYGLFISCSHWIWFSVLSLFCSQPKIRNRIFKYQQLINRLIGVILCFLGFSLLFLNI